MKALQSRYAGRAFRSRTEARWAIFFDACGIPYQHEPEGFALPSGPYLPDFYLHTFGLYFEVKGEDPTPAETAKCLELARATDRNVLLGVGPPDERFQVRWYDPRGEDENTYAIAADSAVDGFFWLISEDGLERWMGGNLGDRLLAGPCFSPLAPAYEAALAARFEQNLADRRVEKLVFPMKEVQRRKAAA